MFKLLSPATVLLAGSTSSGKTTFAHKIIQHRDKVFNIPPTMTIIAYTVWDKSFEKFKESKDIFLHEGLPTREDVEKWAKSTPHLLLVLEDMQNLLCSTHHELEDLFTALSHHLNMSVLYMAQAIFVQGSKFHRIASLNSHYMILFRNYRDENQVRVLGAQIYPGKTDFFLKCYKHATGQKYRPLIIDMSPHSDDRYRLRCGLHPDVDEGVFVYKQKKTAEK